MGLNRTKKVKKKTCSKAKREKEILHDLGVLDRYVKTTWAYLDANPGCKDGQKLECDMDRAVERQRILHEELKNLWAEMPMKKRRARAREGHL